MTLAALLCAFLLVTVVAWHYGMLVALRQLMPDASTQHRHFPRVVGILVLLVGVHLVEIVWCAGGIALARDVLQIGGFTSEFEPSFRDYLYVLAGDLHHPRPERVQPHGPP